MEGREPSIERPAFSGVECRATADRSCLSRGCREVRRGPPPSGTGSARTPRSRAWARATRPSGATRSTLLSLPARLPTESAEFYFQLYLSRSLKSLASRKLLAFLFCDASCVRGVPLSPQNSSFAMPFHNIMLCYIIHIIIGSGSAIRIRLVPSWLEAS